MPTAFDVLPLSPPATSTRKERPVVVPSMKISVEGKLHVPDLSFETQLPLGTPDESPASFPGSSGSGSGSRRKRVEFSPWANIHNPPPLAASAPCEFRLKALPPSRERPSSTSILKSSSTPIPLGGADDFALDPQCHAEMLESLLKQLSKDDSAASLDAYQTLTSVLKAYSEVPDAQTWKAKIGSLISFIRRDLEHSETSESGPTDTNLVILALKVLIILVWQRGLSSLLTDEFRQFVLDRSIQVLEQHSASKSVIIHYLHLLAQQNFQPSIIMSNSRASRVLDALKDLHNHIKGNGVISERLMVYQRFLEQARSTMKMKSMYWVEDLLLGLTSSLKDTRSKALECGKSAAIVFSSSSSISRALDESLSREQEGKVFGNTICRRLEKMITSQDDGIQVPEIWATIILLMRGVDGRLENWSFLKEWLKVIQRCFNCSDPGIRAQANLAWNRFVFATRPNETTDSLLAVLTKPIIAQLDKSTADKQSKNPRATPFSCYCNLLYYAFRPAASQKQYNRSWDECVSEVMKESFLEKNSTNSDRSCRILMALFWNANIRSKFWKENRVFESSTIEPEELPTIDCKWIRSRTASVLKTFRGLFRCSSWGPACNADQAFIAIAWMHFSRALGNASCKEIKPSAETTQVMAHVLEFLQSMWQAGPSALGLADGCEASVFLGRFQYVCKSFSREVGPLPFAEVSISRASGRFCPASSGKDPSLTIKTPAAHILDILAHATEGVLRDEGFVLLVQDFVSNIAEARSTPKLRVRFYRQCLTSVLAGGLQSHRQLGKARVWQAVALLVEGFLTNQISSSARTTDTDFEEVIQDTISILGLGFDCSRGDGKIWKIVLDSLVALMEHGNKRNLVSKSILELLTTCFDPEKSSSPSMLVAALANICFSAVHVLDTTDAVKQGKARSRDKASPELSPVIEKLLAVSNFNLFQSYFSSSPNDDLVIPHVIEAVMMCLQSCPADVLSLCLPRLEQSLCLWLEDKQHLCTSTSSMAAIRMTSGRKLCDLIITCLGQLGNRRAHVGQLASLFDAGFKSSRINTVNHMVEMWNRTYGKEEVLDYPPSLRRTLQMLRCHVDIALPGFPVDAGDALADVTPPYFAQTQDETKVPRVSNTPWKPVVIAPRPQSHVSSSPQVQPSRQADCHQRHDAKSHGERTPVRAPAYARLRHDDSQIQYVSVESSPIREVEADSQNLTERQKEVRAKQQAEATVVFAELRSSPFHKHEVPKTDDRSAFLKLDIAQESASTDHGPTTPTLPLALNADLEDASAISPTPPSKHHTLRLDDIDIPSSPPSMPGVVAETGQVLSLERGHLVVKLAEDNADLSATPNAVLCTFQSIDPALESHADEQLIRAPERDVITGNVNRDDAPVAMTQAELAIDHAEEVTHEAEVQESSPFPQLASADNAFTEPLELHDETFRLQHPILNTRQVCDDTSVELSDAYLSAHSRLDQWECTADRARAKEEVYLNDESTVHIDVAPMVQEQFLPTDSNTLAEDAAICHVDHQEDCNNDLTFKEHEVVLPPMEQCVRGQAMEMAGGEDAISPVALEVADPTSIEGGEYLYPLPMNSDDLEEQSASQLSHDLERYTSIDASSAVENTPDLAEHEIRKSPRKRKQEDGYHAKSKRRKHNGSFLSTRPRASRSSSIVHEQPRKPEVFDCIVVDMTATTQRTPSSASEVPREQESTPPLADKRKRGRPSKAMSKLQPPNKTERYVLSMEADEYEQEHNTGVRWSKVRATKRRKASAKETAVRHQRVDIGDEESSVVEDSEQDRQPDHLHTRSPMATKESHEDVQMSPLLGKVAIDKAEQAREAPLGPSHATGDKLISGKMTDEEGMRHRKSNGQSLEAVVVDGWRATAAESRSLSTTTEKENERQVPIGIEDGRVDAKPLDDAPTTEIEEVSGNVVVGSLQRILAELQRASIDRRTLREIDDVLFEVRTEAQRAVGRVIR